MAIGFLKQMAAGFSLLLALNVLAQPQANLALKEILEKNAQASGGREQISRIQNFSFKANQVRYILSPNEQMMKIETGKNPVVREVVLVGGDKVQKNVLNTIGEVTGLEKAVYQGLAKLLSGLFSLLRFDNQLEFNGLKSYGSEKFYCLTTTQGELLMEFFLNPDTCTLKRVVFRGIDPDGDKYEASYEFGPFIDVEGVKIPKSWFVAQIGARGVMAELSDIKMNQSLGKDFFSRLDINVGIVEAAEGFLKGNVLDFLVDQMNVFIITNWTRSDIEKAGLKNRDSLVFSIEGSEAELGFFSSLNDMASQKAPLQSLTMIPRLSLETYVIFLFSAAANSAQITAKLKPLVPIQVRKKSL